MADGQGGGSPPLCARLPCCCRAGDLIVPGAGVPGRDLVAALDVGVQLDGCGAVASLRRVRARDGDARVSGAVAVMVGLAVDAPGVGEPTVTAFLSSWSRHW
jgi:hypothetical protein